MVGSLPTARRRSARPLARRRTTYPIVYINKRSNLHFEVARNLNGNTTAAAEDAYFVVRVEHLEFSGTAYWEVKLRTVSESQHNQKVLVEVPVRPIAVVLGRRIQAHVQPRYAIPVR